MPGQRCQQAPPGRAGRRPATPLDYCVNGSQDPVACTSPAESPLICGGAGPREWSRDSSGTADRTGTEQGWGGRVGYRRQVHTPPAVRRSPGGLEQAVYDAVAGTGTDGATAAEVIAAVDPALAYTTVVTTLTRLSTRGVLAHARAGRTVRYSVVGDSGTVVATSTARRMHRLLASAPDREGALAQFVAGLSPDDEARIARLLGDTDTDTDTGGREAGGAEGVPGRVGDPAPDRARPAR